MSKKPSDKTDLPEIPALSREQVHKLLCADYLENLAKLIRRGAVSGFDLIWHPGYEKPVGKLELDSFELVAPMEAKLINDIKAAHEAAARKIPVTDLTTQMEEHGHCERPDCYACNNPVKA